MVSADLRLREVLLAVGLTVLGGCVDSYGGSDLQINFSGAVTNPGLKLDAELGAGADYLLTRRWALGAVLQYQFTPAQLFGSAMEFGGTSFYFALAARLSWLF